MQVRTLFLVQLKNSVSFVILSAIFDVRFKSVRFNVWFNVKFKVELKVKFNQLKDEIIARANDILAKLDDKKSLLKNEESLSPIIN